MIQPTFFILLASLSIAGALGVALARNPVYAVLCLMVTLFALSGIFILLNAFFVAMVQVLIYAGAILVLFLFVVMLLDIAPETLSKTKSSTLRTVGTVVGLLFFCELVSAAGFFALSQAASTPPAGTTADIGKLLFTTYALPFEVASLLLFVGIIGAVVLAKKKL